MGRLWQEHFLEQLRNGATVIDAAKAAGVKRATVNEERLRNPEFADRWDEIQANLLEEIENALYRSALAGDTTALIFIAKAKLGWTDGPGEDVSDPFFGTEDCGKTSLDSIFEELARSLRPEQARDAQ